MCIELAGKIGIHLARVKALDNSFQFSFPFYILPPVQNVPVVIETTGAL